MILFLLIRHAAATSTGKNLYGTSPGVHLSDHGRAQAADLAERLAPVPLDALYASPLERCLETAEAIVDGRGLRVRRLAAVGEVDYGRWTGRSFASLRRTAAWRLLHERPSAIRFPDGEALTEVQVRAVNALEDLAVKHRRGVVAVVTHGDVIRLALAHAAGLHIDLFQRLQVEPASVSALEMRDGAPRIVRLNDTGTLDGLVPARRRRVQG